MTDTPRTPNHSPTPEFTAYLERDIARTLRHEQRFAPTAAMRVARRVRSVSLWGIGTVAALAVGLVFGNTTGYAAARVEGARQRDELAASAMGTTTQLATLRESLRRARRDLARRAANGSLPDTSLRAAQLELGAMETSMARMELDLSQSRAVIPASAKPTLPMSRAFAITCGALASSAPATAPAAPLRQQGVPIVDLPEASARSAPTLAAVNGLREVKGGKVLVNDAMHRQLKLFDTTLATMTLVADSTSGFANSYGPAPIRLIPWLGDSSLFPDVTTQTFYVLDGAGQVARALALPRTQDFASFAVSYSGMDQKGRLIYRGPLVRAAPSDPTLPPTFFDSDSTPILRADLESRRIDTVGLIKARDGTTQVTDRSDPAHPKVILTLNPLPSLDEWSVLSDGSVAFVRAHDYHIDWVRQDGSKLSSAKLPFDWKRLTEEDKQKLVDSARAAQAALAARLPTMSAPPGDGGGGRGGGAAVEIEKVRAAAGVDPGLRNVRPTLITNFLPLDKITDFYPPLRRNATMPDLDGNLWILPTTSAQSKHGELVYDVVNNKGELFERVRIPEGRSVVGFGKGGVVYLLAGDRTNGFSLERTRLR